MSERECLYIYMRKRECVCVHVHAYVYVSEFVNVDERVVECVYMLLIIILI